MSLPNMDPDNIFEKQEVLLSVVTFNIGDIVADVLWNKTRWYIIFKAILAKNPDIITLHEITHQSLEVFDGFCERGYQRFIPYVISENTHQKRDSWEVMYSKLPVSMAHYVPTGMNSGLSSLSCIIKLQDKSLVGINIYVTTFNANFRESINGFIETVGQHIDNTTMGLVIISTHNWGSYLIPPRGLFDTWNEMNSPIELETTLDMKMDTYRNDSNLRADHIWYCNITPVSMEIITSNGNAEHNGIYANYLINDLNHKGSQLSLSPRQSLSSSGKLRVSIMRNHRNSLSLHECVDKEIYNKKVNNEKFASKDSNMKEKRRRYQTCNMI